MFFLKLWVYFLLETLVHGVRVCGGRRLWHAVEEYRWTVVIWFGQVSDKIVWSFVHQSEPCLLWLWLCCSFCDIKFFVLEDLLRSVTVCSLSTVSGCTLQRPYLRLSICIASALSIETWNRTSESSSIEIYLETLCCWPDDGFLYYSLNTCWMIALENAAVTWWLVITLDEL